MQARHLYVITGGPGAGKTTLVDALAAEGFAHIAEAGRAVIRQQLAAGGDALPWDNHYAFAERMLDIDIDAYHQAHSLPDPVICDRGIPDIIGFLELSDLAIPAHIQQAAEHYRYNRVVMLAPYWPEIFTQDAERKQDAAEAERSEAVMRDVYQQLGYRVVEIPRVTVRERVSFVRRVIGAA